MIPVKLQAFISHNIMNGVKSYLISYKLIGFDSKIDMLLGVFAHVRYKEGDEQKEFYNYIYFTNEKGGAWTIQATDCIGKVTEVYDINAKYKIEAFNRLIEDKDPSTLWQVDSMVLPRELAEMLVGYKVELVAQIEELVERSTKKAKNEPKSEVNPEVVPTESQSEVSEIQPESNESEVKVTEESEVTDSPSAE